MKETTISDHKKQDGGENMYSSHMSKDCVGHTVTMESGETRQEGKAGMGREVVEWPHPDFLGLNIIWGKSGVQCSW